MTSWCVTSSQWPDISKQIPFSFLSLFSDWRWQSPESYRAHHSLELMIQPLPTLYPSFFCCFSMKTLGLYPDSFGWWMGEGGTRGEPYRYTWELGWVPGGDHGGQVRTVCSEMLDNSGPCVGESAKPKWKNRTGNWFLKSRQGEVAKIKMRKAKGKWGQATIYKKREGWIIK